MENGAPCLRLDHGCLSGFSANGPLVADGGRLFVAGESAVENPWCGSSHGEAPLPKKRRHAWLRDVACAYSQPLWIPCVVCRLELFPGGQFALTPSSELVLPLV
jgi:hypothetical protein